MSASNGSRVRWTDWGAVAAVALAFSLIVVHNLDAGHETALVNVSYDPTRELYKALNESFARSYEKQTGHRVSIQQSHGGSSRQARSVIDGKQRADVVTLGLYGDIDGLRKRGLVAPGWSQRLPHNSQPYRSTIVFVVRKGNPRQIRASGSIRRSW